MTLTADGTVAQGTFKILLKKRLDMYHGICRTGLGAAALYGVAINVIGDAGDTLTIEAAFDASHPAPPSPVSIHLAYLRLPASGHCHYVPAWPAPAWLDLYSAAAGGAGS